MAEPIDIFRARLAASRQSVTAPRLAVFRSLLAGGDMSLQELLSACGPAVDRASVYRTVKLFEQLHIIHRIQIGWKYRIELSDQFQHHHHHLHCTGCGAVTALPEDGALEQRIAELAASNGFIPADHQIEIRGLCADCRHQQSDHPPRDTARH